MSLYKAWTSGATPTPAMTCCDQAKQGSISSTPAGCMSQCVIGIYGPSRSSRAADLFSECTSFKQVKQLCRRRAPKQDLMEGCFKSSALFLPISLTGPVDLKGVINILHCAIFSTCWRLSCQNCIIWIDGEEISEGMGKQPTWCWLRHD